MNDAVYKFKRYEDASLVYTGINRHAEENVGLYATVLSREDYEKMAGAQQDSMVGAVGEKSFPPQRRMTASPAVRKRKKRNLRPLRTCVFVKGRSLPTGNTARAL